MLDAERKQQELKELCTPIVQWIEKNANPHTKIIIESDHVEVLSGELSIKISSEEVQEEEKQSIPTHGLLNVGDEVTLLPEGVDPENDNLDFPMHLLEEKFVIDKIEEGSDLITIKNIHNGNKSLVYPHWVAIVK